MYRTRKQFGIGIDLGGTKVSVGILTERGRILAFRKASVLEIKNHPSPLRGQKKLVELIVFLICQLLEQNKNKLTRKNLKGIGLASAGPLNVETGELINPSNFERWKRVSIVKLLERELKKNNLKLPLYFQNDAIAAALAESWVGHAKKLKSFAVITVGTGIGTGVIHNGKPVQFKGMGSEFGHMIVTALPVKSSNRLDLDRSTVEGIASGTGILKRALRLGSKAKTLENLEAKYLAAYSEVSSPLAALCFNLSIGFKPQVILFSGGLMANRKYFFRKLQIQYRKWIRSWNPEFEAPIGVAKAGVHAGLVGAASLVFQNEK